jgi:alpha-beta hydrolase superfamily lysophospholipase
MASIATAKPHPEIGSELMRDWVPQGDLKAYVVLVHGLAEHSGRYERVGSLLADRGFHVRGFDLIGAGGSGGRRWDIDDWGRYHDQVQSHLQWAREHEKPVVLMGHSLGGAIVLGYALRDRPQPDLLVLSAPALGGGAGWQRALVPALAKLTPTLALPNMLNGEHLSRDPAVAKAYFADPLVITKSTCRFGALAFAEIDELHRRLSELDLPTLVIHGGDDKLVPTRFSEPLGALESVHRTVYDGLRHESFNEPEGPEVVADVASWVEGHL